MLRWLSRTLGWLLLALATIWLVDGIVAYNNGEAFVTPMGVRIFAIAPDFLNLVQASVQRYVHPALWDPVIQSTLTWADWAVVGALGLMLTFLGRRREERDALNQLGFGQPAE